MALRMKHINKPIIILFILVSSCQGQINKTIVDDCLSSKQSDLLHNMIISFEDDICNFYNIPKEESEKAFRKYLNEVKVINDKQFVVEKASARSKELLKKSFAILADDVWTTVMEEEGGKNVYILEQGDTLEDKIKEGEEWLEKYKNKHLVRKYGVLIDCFYNKTSFKASKELFKTVSIAGQINPNAYIDDVLLLEPKELNSIELKTFIILELFYTPLDFSLN